MNVPSSRSAKSGIHPQHRPLRRFEWFVLIHLGVMITFATWGFGSGADWVRTGLAWWGSLSGLILLAARQDRELIPGPDFRPLLWLWPLVLFDLLTLIACLSPTFRPVKFGLETLLVQIDLPAWRPSSARPALALFELWLFNALYLSAFNLAVFIRQRRALRGLLFFVGGNALALSVFGTVQKLTHAQGPFFGLVETPQPFFFASFVYHNHWGSFALLTITVCIGLFWRFVRRREDRDFLHSPAFTWMIVILVIAATVPLSGSRSCSIVLAGLLGGAVIHAIARLVRSRILYRESILLPMAGAGLVLILSLGAIWFVARDSITSRVDQTFEQVGTLHRKGTLGTRATLYRDTWTMARAKLWFGWGTGSYPHVFQIYNTFKPDSKQVKDFYADAHNDWLQSLAEHGLIGSALLALCVLIPLSRLRARHLNNLLPAYLLVGCSLILLYAWVEFPFGNAAVTLLWWVCFFTALKYSLLEPPSAPVVKPVTT